MKYPRLRIIRPLFLGALLVGLIACGQPKPPAEPPAPATPPVPESPPASTATAAPAMPRHTAPAGATVAIVSPAADATVSNPVKVVLDIQGIALKPAGDATPDSGHHHLLVDVPLPEDASQPLIKDEQHIHLGQAQTETELTLTPGTHTLQAVLGDLNHVPHDPPIVSAPITITVQ